jgi:hypothetical protein
MQGETSIYVGIDNGINGGLVALSAMPGAGIIASRVMPIQKTRKGNEINISAVWDWVTEFYVSNATIILEEPGGSKSASAAASMAASFAALRAMCELKGIRHHRITPQKWQKALLNCGKGDTKPAALTLARSLWPDQSWLPTERCRVPHDGMIDAALIAEYARRNRL